MQVAISVVRGGRVVSNKKVEIKTHPRGTSADKNVNRTETRLINHIDKKFFPELPAYQTY